MLPVVTRELTVAARRRGTYSNRFASALVAILAMTWLFVVNAATNPAAQQGKLLFTVLSSLAFVYAVLAGALATSDSISTEKRDGTLGLLFLTPLKGYQIIFGKFVASSLNVFFILVTLVPMIGVGIMLGGVSGFQFALVFAALMNTMFLSLASGVLVSTISRNEREAMFGTIGMMICFTAAPFVLAISLAMNRGGTGPWNGLEPVFLLPSPLFAFITAQGLTARVSMYNALFQSLVIVHVLGWLLLAIASGLLPRVALEQKKTRSNATSASLRQRWVYGKGESRRRHRKRLLDRNAFAWLAARDRLKPFSVWFFLGSLGIIGAFLTIKTGVELSVAFFDAKMLTGILFFVHGFLKIWFTSETCSRLSEDRRIGALELLLSSPLNEREILRGQGIALRRQFLWPILCVLAFDAWLWFTLPGIHEINDAREAHLLIGAGMLFLVLDLFTIKWVGMWLALSASKLNFALVGTIGRVLGLPWLIFGMWFFGALVVAWLGQSLFGGAGAFGTGGWAPTVATSVLVWTTISIVIDLWVGLRARHKLLHKFRTVAANRFQGGDEAVITPETASRRVKNSVDLMAIAGKRAKRPLFKRHPWKLAFGCALLVIGLSLAIYRIDLKRKIARELALVRQRGEPVSIQDVAARDQLQQTNATRNVLAALPDIMAVNIRGGGWYRQNPAGTRKALTPESLEDYRQAVALNTNALAVLHAIVPFQKGRISVGWTDPYGPNYDLYRKLSMGGHLLRMDAILRADEGDIEAACRSLGAHFGIAHVFTQESSVFTRSYRHGCLNSALDSLEFMLSRAAVSEDQLKRMEDLIERTEAASDNTAWLKDALAGDRVMRIHFLEKPGIMVSGVAGRAPPPHIEFLFGALRLTGQFDRGLLTQLQLIRQLQSVAPLPFPENIRAAEQIENRDSPQLRAAGPLQILQILTPQPFVAPILTQEASLLARLRAARVALAVERWRLQYPSLPDDVPALVPEFLKEIPKVPFNDTGLYYSRTKSGYKIYSNGVGNPGFTVDR